MKTFGVNQFKEVVDRTVAAVLFVQSNGSIIYANQSAVALCADGDIIIQRQRRLVAVDETANVLLTAALSDADNPTRSEAGAAILLSKHPMRYVAHILPMSSGRRASAGTRIGAVALVFIRQAGLVIPTAAAELSHLYNLTARELTVLMTIVAENNVAQTAAILGLSPNTVRTHLKAIFRKTDVNKQSELVTLTSGIANPFLAHVA